jgi:hypothetical protein
MRTVVLLLVLAAVAGLTAGSGDATANPSPRVVLQPAVIDLFERSTIAVSGLVGRSLQVRLDGATDAKGSPLPWRTLGRIDGIWRGTLPTPALHGLYPIELRRGPGAPAIRSQLFLRVFAPETSTSPSFARPADVVRWWVRTVPRATLAALKAWPRPSFDHRDRRLHRLFVVAFSPPGDPNPADRLGMFVTVVRNGYHGGWRLLEATVEP